jgi:hypothetical protein
MERGSWLLVHWNLILNCKQSSYFWGFLCHVSNKGMLSMSHLSCYFLFFWFLNDGLMLPLYCTTIALGIWTCAQRIFSIQKVGCSSELPIPWPIWKWRSNKAARKIWTGLNSQYLLLAQQVSSALSHSGLGRHRGRASFTCWKSEV